MHPIVMGIETEYSLLWDQDRESLEFRNMTAGAHFERIRRSVSRNPHVMGALQPNVMKTPGRDGYPEIQFLANGSRFYLDGDHPEMSVSECADPRDATLYDEAGMAIIADAVARLQDNQSVPRVYKRSGDQRGHTWGCHENYGISPRLFSNLVDGELKTGYPFLWGTFLVLRQLLTGAGKIGPDVLSHKFAFQHSQRADYITLLHNFNTLKDRSIINTRDEPLADGDMTRRLHVICGEANRCQWSTFLKLALTAAFLRMLQDPNRSLPPLPVIGRRRPDEDYPAAFRMVSRDLELEARYPVVIIGPGSEVSTSSALTAPEMLSRYVNAIAEYVNTTDWGNERIRNSYREAADKAVWAVEQLKTGRWRALYGILDWPTKRLIAEEYLNRKGRTWSTAVVDDVFWCRVRTLGEVSFTALNVQDSMYDRLVNAGRIQTLFRRSEIVRAMGTPPPGRAFQRMQIASKYRAHLHTIDWYAVQFKQAELTTTIGFPMGFGVSQPELDRVLSVCPTPVDFASVIEREPIAGLVATISYS